MSRLLFCFSLLLALQQRCFFTAVVTHLDVQLTFSLNRVSIYAILFIAFRNILELSALQYFDRQL